MGATTGFASKCPNTRGIRYGRGAGILRGPIEKTIASGRVPPGPRLP